MRETELKFTVPATSLDAVRRALRAGKVSRKRLRATYYDTAAWHLAKQHASLRLRREGAQWVQTAKARTPQTVRRLEHNVSLPVRADVAPRPDPRRHAGTAVGEVLRKTLGKSCADGSGLSPRFVAEVFRTTRTVRTVGSEIEIALDTGTIEAGERTSAVSELELELKSGSALDLTALAALWVGQHGLWLNVESKAERGLRLARGLREPGAVKAEPPEVGKHSGRLEFFAATLESCLAQALHNASLLAEGHVGDEIVHQLRVGLRRLRTALRELGDIGTAMPPEWEAELRKTFQELGRHRDRTVVLAAVRSRLEAAHAPAFADPKPTRPTRCPVEVARDPSFQKTLLALIGFADEHGRRGPASDREAGRTRAILVERLDKLLRRICRDGKRFDRLDSARQHRVRKRLKKLRYLCEFAAPLFGARRVDRYLARWQKAQKTLGRYNDQRIAIQLLKTSVPADRGAWFAVGWLQADKPSILSKCRAALEAAARAEPFWR